MVPIILLTGFLGAGKTTFLNWLLKNSPDLKISIILNEFGDTHLETQFIKQESENIIELANGCMCCVAKSDIPRVISVILEKSPQTEYIVIEASGLSDPDPVHEALRTPPVSTTTFLENAICIVDAVNFETMRTENSVVTSQIADADLVLISKVEEAGQEKVDKVEETLGNLTPDVRVLRFTEDLPVELFLTKVDLIKTKNVQTEHHHIHENYEVYCHEDTGTLQLEKLVDFLDQLPINILRIKAVTKCVNQKGEFLWIQVQKVGSRLSVEGFTPKETNLKNTILFVGKNFDKDVLKSKLESYKIH